MLDIRYYRGGVIIKSVEIKILKGISFENTLLKKLFNNIKRRNFYTDTAEDRRKEVMRDDLILKIEDFFIRNNNIEYFYTEKHEIPFINEQKIYNSYSTFEYLDLSQRVYDSLVERVYIFVEINSNKEYYKDDNRVDSNEEKKEIFLHSIEIVRKELNKIKDTYLTLYEEVDEYLIDFEIQITSKDYRQNKYSGLQSLIKVLKDSNTNYILKSKYGEKYYPIIVDIFLDYLNIMDALISYDDVLKNKRKRYKEFRSNLMKNDYEIHPSFYYLVKFSKQERVTNVKRYILKFYLEELNKICVQEQKFKWSSEIMIFKLQNLLYQHKGFHAKFNDKNMYTLFRKIFVSNLKVRDEYSKRNMDDYLEKNRIHLIFSILVNSRYFL